MVDEVAVGVVLEAARVIARVGDARRASHRVVGVGGRPLERIGDAHHEVADLLVDPVASARNAYGGDVVGVGSRVGETGRIAAAVFLARHPALAVVLDVLELVVAEGILDRGQSAVAVVGKRPALAARILNAGQPAARVAVLDVAAIRERDLLDQRGIGGRVGDGDRPASRVGDRGELAARVGERRRRQEARLDLGQVAGAVEEEGALVARHQLEAVVREALEDAVEALGGVGGGAA